MKLDLCFTQKSFQQLLLLQEEALHQGLYLSGYEDLWLPLLDQTLLSAMCQDTVHRRRDYRPGKPLHYPHSPPLLVTIIPHYQVCGPFKDSDLAVTDRNTLGQVSLSHWETT